MKRIGSEKASSTSSSIFVLDFEAIAFSLLTTILENKDLKNTNRRSIKIPRAMLLKLIPKTPSFQIVITIFKKLSIGNDINLFVKNFVDIYINYKKLNISLPTPSISSSGSI